MKFTHPLTCPNIDEAIIDFEDSLQNDLMNFVDDIKSSKDPKVLIEKYSDNIFGEFIFYAEKIRDSNSSIRKTAEDDVEALEKAIDDLTLEVDNLEKEVKSLLSQIDNLVAANYDFKNDADYLRDELRSQESYNEYLRGE